MRLIVALIAAALLHPPAFVFGATSEKGVKVALSMIEAHGGMAAWEKTRSVYFEDQWITPDNPDGRRSQAHIIQGSRKASVVFPDMGTTVGWDGEKAWHVGAEPPFPPRFWALLNYYFLLLPWLTQDPGVILGEPRTITAGPNNEEVTAVKMEFEPGTGDTPDDYYDLFIDPETHRLLGCEYIVTYKALLPEGVKHTPAKRLWFRDYIWLDGLLVPTGFDVYKEGDPVYQVNVKNWSFRKPVKRKDFILPKNGVVDASTP